jgi:hypothetical protein
MPVRSWRGGEQPSGLGGTSYGFMAARVPPTGSGFVRATLHVTVGALEENRVLPSL